MTPRHLLREASLALVQVTDCPALEAELLLQHVMQKNRAFFLAHADDLLDEAVVSAFQALLAKRLTRIPIAYLTQKREFWSLELSVSPATLIPRPETETLVALVLARYPDKNSALRLADLGTGSGAIALALAVERPNWQIVATDVSQSALEIAKINAQQLALDRISFYAGSWCTALPVDTAKNKFDVIISNPPYIGEDEWHLYQSGLRFEPRDALVSGADGLDAISIIIQTSAAHLELQGTLFIEHGYMQGEKVRQLFSEAGFTEVVTEKDLSGKERVTVGVRATKACTVNK